MNKKYPWLPVNESIIPNIFSFKYPKSPWVRLALFIEIVCAVIAVIGTLILAMLPRSYKTSVYTSKTAASTSTQVQK